MRSNYNFSHVVSARSEAFGTHDISTTNNGKPSPEMTARAEQLKDQWIRKTAEMRDATGNKIGFEAAKLLYEKQFGKQ